MCVSSLDSPFYNLANYIHSIIQGSIKKPRSHIKDGWSFSENIRGRKIGDDETMVSLDVTSLFTNIPKELVLKGIENCWEEISKNTKLNLAQFLYVIELILDSTSFSFEGQFYEQIFASPMGSPLSSILAYIIMDDLESHCLSLFEFDLFTILYTYVDDIFTIIPIEKIDTILSIFNNYHDCLKFTYETECNSALNFLNTIIIRPNKNLITNWYRKPTWSGRYINFLSSHPTKYKINIIYNLVDHVRSYFLVS